MKQCEKKINRIKKIYKDHIKQYQEIESILLNENNVKSHQHSKNDINIMQNYNMLSKRLNNFLDLKLEYKNIKELINELLQEDDAVDNLELYNECQDDLNSMYNSIENRSPYLDRNILNFALTLPPKKFVAVILVVGALGCNFCVDVSTHLFISSSYD